jgi:hypothetical protein
MAERAISGRKNADINNEDGILKQFDSSETTQEETLPVQVHYPHHDSTLTSSLSNAYPHPPSLSPSSIIYSPHFDPEHRSLIVDSFLAVTIPTYEILDGNNTLSLGGGGRGGTGTGTGGGTGIIRGEGETFVKYMIKVSGVHTEWIVLRRYSEFLVLHDLIKAKYPYTSSYYFPPKKYFGRFDAKFLEHRRLKLGEWE